MPWKAFLKQRCSHDTEYMLPGPFFSIDVAVNGKVTESALTGYQLNFPYS